MKKLIKLSLLAAAALSFIACKGNDDPAPTPSAEPIISTSDIEALTEDGTIPDDLVDGNWTYQEIETAKSYRIHLDSDEYSSIGQTLTAEQIATVSTWTDYDIDDDEYIIELPIDKVIESTIYNITKSGETYTLTSGTMVVTITAANATVKSLINSWAALYNISISWNGDTTSSSNEMSADEIQYLNTKMTHIIASASAISWKTNEDKTKFYFKDDSDPDEVAEYIIVKK